MEQKITKLFKGNRTRTWTNIQIAEAVGANPDKTLVVLNELVEAGKVSMTTTKDGLFPTKTYGLNNGAKKPVAKKQEEPDESPEALVKQLDKAGLVDFIKEGGGKATLRMSKAKLVDAALGLIEAANDPPDEPEEEPATESEMIQMLGKADLITFIEAKGGKANKRLSKIKLVGIAEELLNPPEPEPEPAPEVEAPIPAPDKPISKMKKADLVEFLTTYTKDDQQGLKDLSVKFLRGMVKELIGKPMPEPEPEPEPEPAPKPKAKKKAAKGKPKAKAKPKVEPKEQKVGKEVYLMSQAPKKYLPKLCKACGEEAKTVPQITDLFGWRTPLNQPTIPQSQCKECRKKAARASAAKKRKANPPKPKAAKKKPAKKAAKKKVAKKPAKKAAKKKAAKGKRK